MIDVTGFKETTSAGQEGTDDWEGCSCKCACACGCTDWACTSNSASLDSSGSAGTPIANGKAA